VGGVVAPRSLPESGARQSAATVPANADSIGLLAVRWAALAPAGGPAVAGRLATVLRRLAATLRSEPFWPLLARGIGAELLATGLCGDPDDPASDVPVALALSLGLLRREAPEARGPAAGEGGRPRAAPPGG
jgi:hypothetical protein